MKTLKHKFFIRLVGLSTLFYGLTTQIANAGRGVLTIIAVVIVVVAVVLQQYWVPMVMASAASVAAGTATAVFLNASTIVFMEAAFGTATILAVGGVVTGVVACAEGIICPGGDGNSGSVFAIVPTSTGAGCTLQIPVTFYIPKLNVSYGCEADPNFSEAQNQIAIYRSILPAGSSQGTLNDWFINQIKNNVGNGFLNIATGDYHSSSEGTAIAIAPYSQLCSANVCQFTDASVPQNSNVAYVAKILGDYGSRENFTPSEGGSDGAGGFLFTPSVSAQGCVSKQNKFLNIDNQNSTAFPILSYSYQQGNAISGPYKTGVADCPSTPPPAASTTATPPTVIIQANGSSGSISISSGSSAVISWTSTNADSCSVSPTGWTGASGSQSTGNLTSSQTYTITCAGLAGSASNSVIVNAVQPSPDFYPISSNDIKATMVRGAAGDSTTATITIVGLNGFSSTVTFSIYSISPPFPSGTTYEFSRTTIDSSHYASGATFKVHIGSGLDVSQQYSIIVQATGSGLTRTTTVLLNANVKNPTWIEF